MALNGYIPAEEVLATEHMQKILRDLILTNGKAFSSRISKTTSQQLMRLRTRSTDCSKVLKEPEMKDLLQRLAWNISDGDSVAMDLRHVFFRLTDKEFIESTSRNRDLPRNLREVALGVLRNPWEENKAVAQKEDSHDDKWINNVNSKEQIINVILDQSKSDAYRAAAALELGCLPEEWEDEIRDYCIRTSHRSEFPSAVRLALAESARDACSVLDLAEDVNVERGCRVRAILLCDKMVGTMESTAQKVRLLKRRNVIALNLELKANLSIPDMYSRKYIETKPYSAL